MTSIRRSFAALTSAAAGYVIVTAVAALSKRAPSHRPAPPAAADVQHRREPGETLKIIVATLAASGVIAVIAAALFIWSGLYNVAATSEHASLTRLVLHRAMTQSVRTHAPEMQAPPLDDPERIKLGAAHFRTACAPCHGAPDQAPSPIEIGATPPPPPLYSASGDFTPSQLHWIIKHGVKMTAMPPWPTQDRDDEIWAMVAFLEALPHMRPKEFASVAESGAPAERPSASTIAELDAPAESQRCAACHGAEGQGAGTKAPKLAGLSSAYIIDQLTNFRDGTRPSGIMRPMAVGLSDAAAKRLADYFSREPRSGEPSGAGSAPPARAAIIATQGLNIRAQACDSCHAHPDNTSVPLLTGQSKDYLESQLALFRDGVRRGPNSDGMRMIAKALSPADAKALAAYYASLQTTAAAAK